MLAAELAFQFHEFHKGFFGEYFEKYIFQGTISFGGIVIIQYPQVFVDPFTQLFRIHFIIGSHIPAMRKEILVGESHHGVFRDADIKLITHQFNGLIHIFHTQVFAGQTEKMFGASGNDQFAPFEIGKLDGIPDQVSPGAGIGTHQQGVFFSFFHFVNHFSFRFINHLAVGIKVLIVKRNKLEEDIIIQDQLHAFCMFAGFITDKAFTG